MPIDFFATPCNNPRGNCSTEPISCLQDIPNNIFGINDENGNNSLPAKINGVNPNPKTDFIVTNNSNTQVVFKAIDWCVDIYRTGTYNLKDENRVREQFSSDSIGVNLIKRCEGFLKYNDEIVFIEIKSKKKRPSEWIEDAREKFEETILCYKEHHPHLTYEILKPIIANPKHSGLCPNEMTQKKILKDKVGVEFIRQNSIAI